MFVLHKRSQVLIHVIYSQHRHLQQTERESNTCNKLIRAVYVCVLDRSLNLNVSIDQLVGFKVIVIFPKWIDDQLAHLQSGIKSGHIYHFWQE